MSAMKIGSSYILNKEYQISLWLPEHVPASTAPICNVTKLLKPKTCWGLTHSVLSETQLIMYSADWSLSFPLVIF